MTHPHAALFFVLLLALGALPFLRGMGLPDWPVNLLLAAALLRAVAVVVPGRWRRLVVAGIGALVAARLVGLLLGWGAGVEEALSVLWAAAAVGAAAGAVRTLFRPGVAHGERLYAALSAYLLVGIFLGVLYAAIAARRPEAFLVLGGPAAAGSFGLTTAVYFSFVTLATLGYGDIVPVVDAVRGLVVVEAIGGQLYLAVLVAGLIGARGQGAISPGPTPGASRPRSPG